MWTGSPPQPTEGDRLIEVRPATRDDLPWMIHRLREYTEEIGDPYFAFAGIEYAMSFVGGLIDNHLVFVSEENGKRTGFISGMTTPHPFNPANLVTASLFWYVLPARRGSRTGFDLLRELAMVGADRGGSTLVGIREGAGVRERSMARCGFKLHERVYRRPAGVQRKA